MNDVRLNPRLLIFALSVPLFPMEAQDPVSILPFSVERQVVLKREAGVTDGSYWMHPRAAIVPAAATKQKSADEAVMVLFRFLGRSDHYSGLYTMRSADEGVSWSEPRLEPSLDWIQRDGVNIAVADVTPGWHQQSGKLIAIGAQVRYSETGKQLEDEPRSHQTAYAVYDPSTEEWSSWHRLEMPDGAPFNFARSACAQWLEEEDGTVLLPCYIGEGTHRPFSSTVVRCRFDGERLHYLEHGTVLSLEVKRGLYEPSLIRHRGRYFLTMRNDLAAYVTTSEDGLKFSEPVSWKFEDGSDLGSYNTQAHWVSLGGELFLVYTRRGADNDHVVRHRAPLFMAQVNPVTLRVIRATEQVLVPERGATLGNSGVTVVSPDEAWITVSEANIDRPEAVERGADGSLYVVKVRSGKRE